MAIVALRAQQERENPKPLTLDDLRMMQEEPVWIFVLETGFGHWAIKREVFEYKGFECICFTNADSVEEYREFVMYSKTWLAYRHKPKEVL